MALVFYSESASVPTGIASGGAVIHLGEYVFGWISSRNRDNRMVAYRARPWWTKPIILTLMAANTCSGMFTVLSLEAFGRVLVRFDAKDSGRVRVKMLTMRSYFAVRSWPNMFRFRAGRDEVGSYRLAGFCVELGITPKEGE